MTDPISPMLRLFRDGVKCYQPAVQGLALESGEPQVSRDNVQRMIDAGLVLADFMVRPTGVLVVFATGEQYYAPGLRVGSANLATEALAHFAAKAGFGPEAELLGFYRDLPETYKGKLPDLRPDSRIDGQYVYPGPNPSSGQRPS
jgi:hypothetical protein